MDFVRGLVVRSLRGRDKGEFLVVLEVCGKEVILCDGKRRPLEKPKRKNLIHLAATNTLLSSMNTNREIRCALRRFSQDS
ncbi:MULTISPECIES: KOW domain-containing RNA-binding protein [Clostridium]|uniref:KOW domain-containing RNA-binding protein n=1 Tax=Clostridium TaxID=1485 RepID=UPI000A2699B3|nr:MULTISPECIES: KOW domain-containing RNA-binding protein [Clostridium]MDU7338209.1 KOW domain-containing RNA-binding protein [Clostridium sp.]